MCYAAGPEYKSSMKTKGSAENKLDSFHQLCIINVDIMLKVI